MLTQFVVLDVSSAPLTDAAAYMGAPEDMKPPSNYTKPDSIAKWQQEEYAERLAKAGLDIDLAQITGVALWLSEDAEPMILTADTTSEATMLVTVAAAVKHGSGLRPVVTYNGHAHDLPLLMRRALYLSLPFPALSVDRFKSSNVDVLLELSLRDPQRRRSLQFYARRLGWTDIQKPLSGESESRVLQTQDWTGLRASLLHDVTATHRLAKWAKLCSSR